MDLEPPESFEQDPGSWFLPCLYTLSQINLFTFEHNSTPKRNIMGQR